MEKPWTPTKGAKSKRLAEARLLELLSHAAHIDDTSFLDLARRNVPEAWLTLEMDLDVAEPKDKVTLYLSRSVLRMFKSMGHGYQARINRILETWMQMKIANKEAFEMSMMDAIRQAQAESDTCSVPPEKRRREALHEHWAYAQGVFDTLKRLGMLEGE